METQTNEFIEERKKSLQVLKDQGIDPYGSRLEKIETIESILTDFTEGREVRAAGRIMAWRSHGKTVFADIMDRSSRMQLYIKKKEQSDSSAFLMDYLDIGDIVFVEGKLFKTKTDMPTIQVSNMQIMSKALRPLPEKWHGLKNVESRYRQRYLDLLSNQETRKIFKQRSQIIAEIRRYLDSEDYLEVETPMMHSIPGGAAGRPFQTHHEALNIDLYMRIAPELYLKRLLVGGLDRVYEINKSFRNEGISTRHNPEFTMLEVYTSFFDANDVMDLTENIIRSAVQKVHGSLVVNWQDSEIDFSKFERISFASLMKDAFDIDPEDEIGVWAEKLKKKGVDVPDGDVSRTKLVNIIGELIEPKKRKNPVFVTDYFTELCPLAKKCKDKPEISERFELFIGGMEIANGYSELNDPQEQKMRFEEDLDPSDPEKSQKVDMDFVRALEYGMPPAGGLGIGIDRLVMIITNQPSIREVVLFPQLKPEITT